MKLGDLVKMKVPGIHPRHGGTVPDNALGIVVDLDGGNSTWVTVSWNWEEGQASKIFLRDIEVVK